MVQTLSGEPRGHTCDLMAMDSNAQCNYHDNPLPHFARVPTPHAMGVNLFVQGISIAVSSCVFVLLCVSSVFAYRSPSGFYAGTQGILAVRSSLPSAFKVGVLLRKRTLSATAVKWEQQTFSSPILNQ